MSTFQFVTFGEVMVRFAPKTLHDEDAKAPSGRGDFTRSIGGDELNVAIALSKLGRNTNWRSVLPKTGTLGEYVKENAIWNGVCLDDCVEKEGEEMATFYVLPRQSTVDYQRKFSAWARQGEGELGDWDNYFTPKDKETRLWLHTTGITPSTGENPAKNWKAAMNSAIEKDIPISMDLNHRKQLITLKELWSITKPFVSKLHILILSISSLEGIAEIEGVHNSSDCAAENQYTELMTKLREKCNIPKLACCFKVREESGVQKRWSVVVDKDHVHSTINSPVFHQPKDHVGGGSAWAAGYIDYMFEFGVSDELVLRAIRRADILAALCQEELGDHSTVTREELQYEEKKWEGKPAKIGIQDAHNESLMSTLARIKEAKVIPILRAKNKEIALKRAVELVDMGCKVIEVTMDTTDALNVLRELCNKFKDKCLVGVGTVMDAADMVEIATTGIKFALSPINPPGFIKACHIQGILAIPAAFSPQEIWKCKLEGAHCVKLFPAQLLSPSTFSGLRGVGRFKEINYIPSGGIDDKNATEWLKAGACAVGMGSKLTGGDIKLSPTDPKLPQAIKAWEEGGKTIAAQLFQNLANFK